MNMNRNRNKNKNKKEKFKWENIEPNNDAEFKKVFKIIMQRIYCLQSDVQQLAAIYKSKNSL